jgi:methionyl-tRNA formyltransferase
MGTPIFACPSLEALLARTDDAVVGVICQPDRPRGRGLAVTAPEVKRLAAARGLPVLQPERLSDPGFAAALRALAPDLIVVAAYGKILPRWILDLPPHGCINVHASLLPRHRGAAPIPWAILAGDATTGVTIMVMNEEMDAGDVLLARAVAIEPEDTAGTLGARLAALGAAALVEAIDGLKVGRLRPTPQPAEGITFAPRLTREQGRLDWSRTAAELDRVVRAFTPAPGAFTTLAGRLLKVHRARPETHPLAGSPGTIVHAGADGIVVATGAGALRLLEVQLEGRRRLAAGAFLAGHPLAVGTCLGAP